MDINDISNFIEAQYIELHESKSLNTDYQQLYKDFKNSKLIDIFSSLHHLITISYRSMNSRLPTLGIKTDYYWAQNSKELLNCINIANDMQKKLMGTEYSFYFDVYYDNLFKKSKSFLKNGGSIIPTNMDKVTLYYTKPIFIKSDSLMIQEPNIKNENLKLIGSGSYANVYRYHDNFYNTTFVLKRAKNDLTEKEKERFIREFEEMKKLNSPYIVKVYDIRIDKMEYIMEYMDYTLNNYIEKNNTKLTFDERKKICNQILQGFSYIHGKNLLHRDISPNNVLIKLYEDVIVVKIADFGLVKIPDSSLTSVNSEFKGYFNDPNLMTIGFDNYSMKHETYALTHLIFFVLTGKKEIKDIKNESIKSFVDKGMGIIENRYENIDELILAIKQIKHF